MARIFTEKDLIGQCKIESEAFLRFLSALDDGYDYYENPYHNSAHGASVAFTMNFLLESVSGELVDLISALSHSYAFFL